MKIELHVVSIVNHALLHMYYLRCRFHTKLDVMALLSPIQKFTASGNFPNDCIMVNA